LEQCTQQDIPWGIVTNKPSRYTDAVLQQLPLQGAATVICRDHVAQPKPHPESMFLACKEIGIAPADCLYVGDHIRDIEAGRAAGMRTIAAAWGYIEAGQNVHQWNADWVVEQSQQLHSLLFN
jgi:phosphoglycolate phosphatase